MADDLDITGATVGDISHVVVYYDVTTGNLYDSNGQLYGNSRLTSFLDNEFILEVHYVQDVSTSDQPSNWQVWDGLNGYTVSSTLAFDKDYIHSFNGEVLTAVSSGASTLSLSIGNVGKNSLSNTGTLVINPYGSSDDRFSVDYTSYVNVSGSTFTFNITGLTRNIEANTAVRVSDPLYIYVNPDEIYEKNIPDRYSSGVFNFPIHIMSRKLLNELDSTGVAQVSGTMEHKIYVENNKLVGVSVSGATYTRSKEDDTIATATSETVPHLFCCWKKTTSPYTGYYTKGNTVTTSTALYTISNGVASLSQYTADPVYVPELVLFRTFAFPFIVKNLIDYGTAFTIPVDNINWFKDYIISIIEEYMANH